MKWEDIEKQTCSVARALAVVGERWTLLILRDIFMGARRFDEIQSSLGITRHRLAERLAKLVKKGVLVKVLYQDKPVRYEYKLTRMGLGLYPVLMSLTRWGDDWLDNGDGAPVEYVHKNCGLTIRPTLSCGACGEAIRPENTVPILGGHFQTNTASSIDSRNIPLFISKLDTVEQT